mgnify:CR=1 FL=1
MTAQPFVHLHVHTEFSLVDSTVRIPKLMADQTIEHSLVVCAFAFLAMKGLLDLSAT